MSFDLRHISHFHSPFPIPDLSRNTLKSTKSEIPSTRPIEIPSNRLRPIYPQIGKSKYDQIGRSIPHSLFSFPFPIPDLSRNTLKSTKSEIPSTRPIEIPSNRLRPIYPQIGKSKYHQIGWSIPHSHSPFLIPIPDLSRNTLKSTKSEIPSTWPIEIPSNRLRLIYPQIIKSKYHQIGRSIPHSHSPFRTWVEIPWNWLSPKYPQLGWSKYPQID